MGSVWTPPQHPSPSLPPTSLTEVSGGRRAWENAGQQQGQKWSELVLSSYCFSKLLGCFQNRQEKDGTVSGRGQSDSQGSDPGPQPWAGHV